MTLDALDAVVAELYRRISFAPGGTPDWDGLRELFAPDARLLPPPRDPAAIRSIDVDGWIRESQAALAHGPEQAITARGFVERALGGRVERFGTVAHVLSAYGSWFADAADGAPFARGVNSIQLVAHGGVWRVASLAWDVERPDQPIPPDLLGDGSAA